MQQEGKQTLGLIKSITIFDELDSCNESLFVEIIFKFAITTKNYSKYIV